MTNRNIDLPSKRALLLNEIEEPIRRKFRKQKSYAWLWWLIVIALILGSYYEVSNIVDYQAKQAMEFKKAQAAEMQPICNQYLNDAKLNGTAAMETLKQICP